MSLAGEALTGQAVSGMEVARARSAAFGWNRRRRIWPLPRRGGGGEPRSGTFPAGGVRVPGAGCAGGPARSSGEALVMGVERRGRVVRDPFVRSTGSVPGGVAWTS